LRGGNETSNFPEIPPGATEVGPMSEPGSGADCAVGDVGDAAEDRSGSREHPAINAKLQTRIVRGRDISTFPESAQQAPAYRFRFRS
jgi:hypothetical protein